MYRLNYDKKDLGPSFMTAVTTMVVASLALGLIFGAQASGWKFWLMQALYTLLIGGSAILYAALTKTKVFVATKLNIAPRYAHILWGCLAVTCLIACMMPINNALLDGIEALGLKRPSVTLDDNIVGLLIVACVLPAICEELVFRGTVAQCLSNGSNKLATLAISGALFSVFHANPAQTLHQFVLGAFLTLLVLRSGSLWASVIVHLFNNTLVVLLSYTAIGSEEFWSFTTNTGVVVACLVVGVVGFVASVFGYLKTTKSVWNCCDQSVDETSHTSSSTKITPMSTVMLAVAVTVCVALWVAGLFAL
ncbi:MAG: CPBP family intramembrane metalloprotease [Clostridiales bacterium]|nr:CPBP family intramembrane metalloprotease [Clostridiales bacterium]